MIELQAQELVDNEYIYCDRCGLLTHEDEMRHAYCYNGYEYWGEPIYSECEQCADAEWELHRRAVWERGSEVLTSTLPGNTTADKHKVKLIHSK